MPCKVYSLRTFSTYFARRYSGYEESDQPIKVDAKLCGFLRLQMPGRNAMPGKKYPGTNQTMRDRKKSPLIILRKNKGIKPINGLNSMVDRRQNAGIGAIIRKVQFKQKLMKLRKDLPLYSVAPLTIFFTRPPSAS